MMLAVIPARGGSRELRRKNLLPIGGVPMFLRTAHAASLAGLEVVVSTDDAEIDRMASASGFRVHWRGSDLAEVPVDQVVAAVCRDVGWSDEVMLVQPTVQPIDATMLAWFAHHRIPTLDRLEVVAAGVAFPHQLWIDGRCVTERVNRQDMTTVPTSEVGIRWWPGPDWIGQPPTRLVELPYDLVDIDTADDWRAAQPRKTIVFGPISDTRHGRGHLHRCLTIAERLQHHDVRFDIHRCDTDAQTILTRRGWPTTTSGVCDLYVADNLGRYHPNMRGDTVADHVLTLEDSGHSGDRTINALYEDGADWAVLRPEFLFPNTYEVRPNVVNVMVMFGGTDPSRTGDRVVNLLHDRYEVTWVRPGDDIPVADTMRSCDLLITSAGRTVFEAAAVGIPTIVLAQNLRETTHTHLGFAHGNVYLGMAQVTSDQTIVDTVDMVAADLRLRQELSATGRPDGRGVDRIVAVIEQMLGGT